METPTFLYKPNFCAECGEKIDRENWHFWHSRRFCADCEPVYRMTRIVPVAFLAGTMLFTGIFLSSQAGNKYQPVAAKEQPVTLAAKAPGNQQPADIKQFAGGNKTMETQAPVTAPDAGPPAAIAEREVRTAVELPAAEKPSTMIYSCGARTQKGTPCSRRVKEPGRCWQHTGKPSMLDRAKY